MHIEVKTKTHTCHCNDDKHFSKAHLLQPRRNPENVAEFHIYRVLKGGVVQGEGVTGEP